MIYRNIQPEATQKSNKLEHVVKYFLQPASLILNMISVIRIRFTSNSIIMKNTFSFRALLSKSVHRTKKEHTKASKIYTHLQFFDR